MDFHNKASEATSVPSSSTKIVDVKNRPESSLYQDGDVYYCSWYTGLGENRTQRMLKLEIMESRLQGLYERGNQRDTLVLFEKCVAITCGRICHIYENGTGIQYQKMLDQMGSTFTTMMFWVDHMVEYLMGQPWDLFHQRLYRILQVVYISFFTAQDQMCK